MADKPSEVSEKQVVEEIIQPLDWETLNSFVDSSVEVGHFNRLQLTEQLQLEDTDRLSTIKMQVKLKQYLKAEHSINDFLNVLPRPELIRLHTKILPNPTLKREQKRIRQEIAETFFVNFPRTPLTSLKSFMGQDSHTEMMNITSFDLGEPFEDEENIENEQDLEYQEHFDNEDMIQD